MRREDISPSNLARVVFSRIMSEVSWIFVKMKVLLSTRDAFAMYFLLGEKWKLVSSFQEVCLKFFRFIYIQVIDCHTVLEIWNLTQKISLFIYIPLNYFMYSLVWIFSSLWERWFVHIQFTLQCIIMLSWSLEERRELRGRSEFLLIKHVFSRAEKGLE